MDHEVPSQTEVSTNNGGDQFTIDTQNFEEPAGDNPNTISTFESSMPSMLNLQTAGLRRSSRIASQESKPSYSCMISRCFCLLATVITILGAPSINTMYSGCQNMKFATVHAFHAANQVFDNTLNVLHPMALATEKR